MSVGSSKVTGKVVTITVEMPPVTIPTTKRDNNKAMINEGSKAIIPTGNNKNHNKTGGIIISRHKIVATVTNRSKTGVIPTSRRKKDKEIQAPSKIKTTLTSNEATDPRTGHHKGLRKTGAVSNKTRREEMIQSNIPISKTPM